MNIRFESQLKNTIASGLKSLYQLNVEASSIILQETKKEFEGDVTLVVFPYTKTAGKSPEQTAQAIGEFVGASDFPLESFNVVKGFLNLSVKKEFWKNYLATISNDHSQLFDPKKTFDENFKPSKLMVEYSSPNTNKPLHLGHVRNNLLGFAVSNVLKACGHEVVMVNLVNDRGIHICKSMLAWLKFGNGETPASTHMKGDHFVGKYYVLYDKKYKAQVEVLEKDGVAKEEAERTAPLHIEIQEMLRKWEAGDPETKSLWEKMNNWVYEGFAETYKKLGVSFDKIYYESKTYLLGKEIIQDGVASGAFFKKEDGSVWIDLTEAGLDMKVLLRSDGTSVYISQDMGTAQLRFDEYPGLEKLIYVVGNEQDYHFKVLKEIFRKLKRSWADGLYHLSYGMVDLPSGKMKSREGTVVDADDLIKEIVEEAEMATKAQGKLDDFNSPEAKELYHNLGMSALKYYILKVDPKKRMLFNPAESIDLNGNTGPFISYTYARIRSVLRKGGAMKLEADKFVSHDSSPEEKLLIKQIYQYSVVIKAAADAYSPALVAQYVYDLAKAYNHFYHEHIVVDAEQKDITSFRLHLSEMTSLVISKCMAILGITVPERM
ncbi:MAG TPA: arginine--tRNA ligase [Bacteroidia bacterium]|nr:arginine--tRNA ligase [Bacteroidia bacterium]